MMMRRKTDRLAAIAQERVVTIGKMRTLLWSALGTLFDNGAARERFSDDAKEKANRFVKPFEQSEDARFFDDLNIELESDNPEETRLQWLLAMVDRAETVLKESFHTGPRSGEQRYRARAVALSRFHGVLRGDKTPFPTIADHYRQLTKNMEPTHEHA